MSRNITFNKYTFILPIHNVRLFCILWHQAKALVFIVQKYIKNSTTKQGKETSFNNELKMKEKNERVSNTKHMFVM